MKHIFLIHWNAEEADSYSSELESMGCAVEVESETAEKRTDVSKLNLRTSHIKVLMHALGYFKDELSGEEKAYFLGLVELVTISNSSKGRDL